MTELASNAPAPQIAPGDASEKEAEPGVLNYVIGLVLAAGLTTVSFYVARGTLFWPPSIPTALIVLAIAQNGGAPVFFLHITSGPDSTNNVLALAFGRP